MGQPVLQIIGWSRDFARVDRVKLKRWPVATASAAGVLALTAAHRGVPGWLRVLSALGAAWAGHTAFQQYENIQWDQPGVR